MISGLREFVAACQAVDVEKHQITARRALLHRSTVGLEQDPAVQALLGRVKLVVTSPPYPGVHVLYHRWQYRGRKETPAPYWIANVADGCGESFYTFGSRQAFFSRGSRTGMTKYAAILTAAFSSIRPLLHPDAIVFQLVAFYDPDSQLPGYLAAMEAAGFAEIEVSGAGVQRLGRRVPNRKWYAEIQRETGSASEILMIHRPNPPVTQPAAAADTASE
jgi:hypothetical protein